MKSTGIVRCIDDMGRIVIPKEIRLNYNLNEGDGMEIFVDSNQIILRKYNPGCILCGNTDDKLYQFTMGKVCDTCLHAINTAVNGSEPE